MNNLPLSVQSINRQSTWSNQVAIGVNGANLNVRVQDDSLRNAYWFVVVDRQTLKAVANFTTQDNSNVPAQLGPYLGNTEYLLIVSTQNLGSAYLPQGALYNFLVSEGAGSQLARLEQVYASFNCGTWGFMAYSFIAVLGNDGGDSFEASTIQDSALLQTVELAPIDVNGKVYYTPISL